MIDNTPETAGQGTAEAKTRRTHHAVMGAVCMLVVGVYVWSAQSGVLQLSPAGSEENYFNLLAQGFGKGQLSLRKEVPLGLAQLTDPHDPVANEPYRSVGGLHDLAYYRGKLYLYFGVTPALVLFWPCTLFTGYGLAYRIGGLIFFSAGFLASAALLWVLWRRYFAGVRLGVVVAAVLGLGLTNFTPGILAWCKAHEVAISCGYALTMLTLLLLWQALSELGRGNSALRVTRSALVWLAAASVAYGLAVAARPSLLVGAVILFVPAIWAWLAKQPLGSVVLATVSPLLPIGLGLMFYNVLRFGDPLEFGQRYQLSGFRQDGMEQFSVGYLWTNIRIGLLAPSGWSGRFPFVQDIAVPPLPSGYFEVVDACGLLSNVPVVGLALVLPFTICHCRFLWRKERQNEESRMKESDGVLHLSFPLLSSLKWFTALLGILSAVLAVPLLLHNSMCLRYQVEIASPALLLAVTGILSLEQALAGKPALWRIARCLWGLLLIYSLAFNLLLSIARHAEGYNILGGDLYRRGRVEEAIAQFRKAVNLHPDNARARHNLGLMLARSGRVAEAVEHFACVVRREPRNVEAHENLGRALQQLGRPAEAAQHLELADRLKRKDER